MVDAGRGEAEEESITALGEKETDGEADMSESSQTGIRQPLSVAGKARVNREVDKDVAQVVETIISEWYNLLIFFWIFFWIFFFYCRQ